MKTGGKRLFLVPLVALVGVVFFLVYSGIRKSGGPTRAIDTELDSVDLHYLFFNRENKKSLELTATQSQKKGDLLYLKDIRAVVYKKGRMEEDIRVSAVLGHATVNFHDFYLEKNALIHSENSRLASGHFWLKNLETLSTDEPVEFRLKNLSGKAAKGIEMNLKSNNFKMNEVEGTYEKGNQAFQHKERLLSFFEDERVLILDGVDSIKTSDSNARGDRFWIKFAEKFEYVSEMRSLENSHFDYEKTDESGRKQYRKVDSQFITNLYDPPGKLREVDVMGGGVVQLGDGINRTQITANAIFIAFDVETGRIKGVHAVPSNLENRGKNDFTISSARSELTYDLQGSIESFKAILGCQFQVDQFKGFSEVLFHDEKKSRMNISGPSCQIGNQNNIFHSPQFWIDTRRKRLSSIDGVSSTVFVKRKNVLFSDKPIYIAARNLEVTDRGDRIQYRENVKLFQDSVELKSRELDLDNRRNRVLISGRVNLKFKNGESPIVVSGEKISLVSAERKIRIEGEARLIDGQNVLKAKQIMIDFNRENGIETITASDSVSFVKDDMDGGASRLQWNFPRKEVLFSESARIARKNGGETTGRELKLNLATNEINVLGEVTRSETVIKK